IQNPCFIRVHLWLKTPLTMPENKSKLSAKSAGVVGLAVMCSRVLGLIRDVLFNALFESKILALFIAAFRVPNLLRDLFAEGALSTAFITTFSKKIATENDAAAWRLANRIGTLTLITMSAITLLGMVFSHQIVGGLLQLVVQFPALHGVGYRTRLDFHWRDEGVATVLRLMAPAVIAA